jgi:FemAB-related protein (PEP-CTERM system-associated)
VRSAEGSHFGQLTAWLEMTARRYRVEREWWLAEDGDRIRGILPLFVRRTREPALFSAPGGLLADDESVANALLEPARERLARERLAYIELRDQRRAWPGLETSDEHVTLEMDLTASPEAQWKRFDAKLRNQIRKGEKAGFRVTWGRDQIDTFHRVLLENLRDLGTPVRGAGYFRDAVAALGDDVDLLVVSAEDGPAGTMFLARHRGVANDPWASSLRRYFARCPNQVLYWEAIQRAIRDGCARFDFGRSQPGSGTFHFKQQWGATPVPLVYQYVLGRVTKPPTLEDQKHGYGLAVSAWKRLPLPLAAALGEPVKTLFPEVL